VMSRARTAQCALLYKGWSGIVEWQGERRRREGHEVNESVADVAADGDCDAGRKTAGDCSLSQIYTPEVPRPWTGSHFFSGDSAFLFRNKQTSTRTRRAKEEPNVWGISTGERIMVWAKLTSGRGGL